MQSKRIEKRMDFGEENELALKVLCPVDRVFLSVLDITMWGNEPAVTNNTKYKNYKVIAMG